MKILQWFLKAKFEYEINDKDRVHQIIKWGKARGWVNPIIKVDGHMLSMFKGEMRMNVYYTTLTVATCLNHPTKGKTQLFRKNVSAKELVQIMDNPRIHAGKGYYTLDTFHHLQNAQAKKHHDPKKNKSKKK